MADNRTLKGGQAAPPRPGVAPPVEGETEIRREGDETVGPPDDMESFYDLLESTADKVNSRARVHTRKGDCSVRMSGIIRSVQPDKLAAQARNGAAIALPKVGNAKTDAVSGATTVRYTADNPEGAENAIRALLQRAVKPVAV